MKTNLISRGFSVFAIMLVAALSLMSARAALLPAPTLSDPANGAAGVSTSPTFSGSVEICFQDSRTGMGVVPDTVLVDDTNVAKLVDASGRLRLDVLLGEHGILISAKGYQDLGTRQTVLAGNTSKSIILLDPTAPSTEPIAEPRSAIGGVLGAAVIKGYMADDATGQPLAGATLAVMGTNATVTDAHGFFTLAIPVGDGVLIPEDNAGRFFVKKDIVVTKAGYGTVEEQNIVLIGGATHRFQFRLVPNGVMRVINEQEHRGNVQATAFDGRPAVADTTAASPLVPQTPSAQSAPCSIRVGQSGCCSSVGACSTVVTMSMETYVKHVLPAEWYPSWNAESLKAGAVAIRSYGGYYVNHPMSPSSSPAYDICDSACCQVYGSTTTTATDSAVDATAGQYMVDGSGNIARTEYAAENNDSANLAGCGNCYTQNKPGDGICLSDSVCCGSTQNGHGRGMCQWGSQRWAANQSQTYTWILGHYYNAYSYTLQSLTCVTSLPDLTIFGSVVVSPTSVASGGTIRVDWTEKNQGAAASTPAHHTKICLSTSLYGTTYTIGGPYYPMNTLGVGATQSYYDNTIVVPASIPAGSYYVTAFVDCNQEVSEGSHEDNNIGSSTPTMLTVTPNNISVTVQPSLSGPSFTVDGITYTTAQNFSWVPGNSHTIATTSPQSGSTGIQYVWSSWSDGGAISHIVAPTMSTTYTANFSTQYLLTMGYGTGGSSVSPGSGWYNSGNSFYISATANGGYRFGSWSGSGSGSYSGGSSSPFITMSGPISETASFIQTFSISTSASPGGSGSTGGGGTYGINSTATVTASPYSCYQFVNWTENGSVVSTLASYPFTVGANRNLVANFSQITYTINTSSSPSGGGTTGGGGSTTCGSSVTVTAAANSGYRFVNWTENGSVVSTSASYPFTAGANRNLVANFIAVYNVTTSSSPSVGGTTGGGGTFDNGSSVTVIATPSSCYQFVNWTENGSVVSTLASYPFTAGANRTLVANFSQATYTINTISSPSGGGTTGGGGSKTCGSSVTVTATANSGYQFVNWTEGGTAVSSSSSYPFTAGANRTLVANFVDIQIPTINVTAPTAGQHMTNALATIVGKANDNLKVASVWYQVNSNPWNFVTGTTNNYTNWTQTVTLQTGSNTLKAYALDFAGNSSTTQALSILSSNTFKLQLAFTNAWPLKTNGLVFSLQLSKGLNGRIQVSSNLTSWATLTNFVGTNTTLNFRDPAATKSSRRYYRAVIP